jgi:hypothetical protein
MDASARETMKDAAKCDKRCEWQNSANQENAERILHFLVIPESISFSGQLKYCALVCALLRQCCMFASLCVSVASAVDALNPVVSDYSNFR